MKIKKIKGLKNKYKIAGRGLSPSCSRVTIGDRIPDRNPLDRPLLAAYCYPADPVRLLPRRSTEEKADELETRDELRPRLEIVDWLRASVTGAVLDQRTEDDDELRSQPATGDELRSRLETVGPCYELR